MHFPFFKALCLHLPARARALLLAGMLILPVSGMQEAQATPYTPSDDDAALETLPDTVEPALRELRTKARDLAGHPRDAVAAADVARRYLKLARRNSDPRLVGYAQAALQPWWTDPNPPAELLFLRASLKQTVHQFDAALIDLQAYLAHADLGRGARAQGLLVRATVLSVIGRYPEATQDCVQVTRYADRTTGMLCTAQTDVLTDRARRSAGVLEILFNQGGLGSDGTLRQWGDTILADAAARLGQPALAERAYKAALSEDSQDAYVLGAYADFLLDQQRPAEVRTLLQPWLRADGLLLRHAIALQQLKDGKAASEAEQMGARFAAARERGDHTHKREEARYQLMLRGDAAAALRLAQANWEAQKEPADVRILAETALATRDAAAQGVVRDWLQRTGLQDQASAALRSLAAPPPRPAS